MTLLRRRSKGRCKQNSRAKSGPLNPTHTVPQRAFRRSDSRPRWKKALDKIEEGADWLAALREYHTRLSADLKAAGEVESVKATGIPLKETCPKCGKPLVIKSGKFGRFKACSGYPDCDYKDSMIKKEVIPLDEKCPTCGAQLVERIGRFGRFVACSNYPTCKYIKKERTDTGIACPNACGGTILKRKTRRGKYLLRLQLVPQMPVRHVGRARGPSPARSAASRSSSRRRRRRKGRTSTASTRCAAGAIRRSRPLRRRRRRARRGRITPPRAAPARRPRRPPEMFLGRAHEKELEEFLDYLKHEKGASPHTLAGLPHRPDPARRLPGRAEGPLSEIDNVVLRGFLVGLYERKLTKASAARKLAAIRSFFEFCVRRKWIEANPAQAIATPRLERRVPGFSLGRGGRQAPGDSGFGRRPRPPRPGHPGALLRHGDPGERARRDRPRGHQPRGADDPGPGQGQEGAPGPLRPEGRRERRRLSPGPARSSRSSSGSSALFLNYQGGRLTTRSVQRLVP